MSKITIIGAGSVGSSIAYNLTITGLANEIVLIDVNHEKALGEALDIRQGTPYCAPCTIYAGSYRDAEGSDIVIVSSGVARKPGQSRLDLAQTNVDITKSIIPEIVRYAPDSMYVIVSNPVDVLTYAFCKRSGLPESHIIGSGTILDTARLRARVAEYYNTNQSNVHAYVFGEHGDSSFIPWSLANISTVPIDQYQRSMSSMEGLFPPMDHAEIEAYVRKSGGQVIARKGATFYAVSIAVCHLCRALLGIVGTNLTVSTMFHGEYGIDDVCLSVLNVVSREGALGKILPNLSDTELAQMAQSAQTLKDVIKNLDI